MQTRTLKIEKMYARTMLVVFLTFSSFGSVHVSGPVTCVKLTWTLAKLAKVRKTTNILRAYIFSIFSVLVRILESISLSRLRALLNVMFGHHGVVKIPMFRASQI